MYFFAAVRLPKYMRITLLTNQSIRVDADVANRLIYYIKAREDADYPQ